MPIGKFLRWRCPTLLLLVLLLVPWLLGALPASSSSRSNDQNRTRLITYVLRQQIERHYSGKEIDDALSRAAFSLYVKQLDYQKRFLLDGEVAQLRDFELAIDDEIKAGRIELELVPRRRIQPVPEPEGAGPQRDPSRCEAVLARAGNA